jgi:hypothetical protein
MVFGELELWESIHYLALLALLYYGARCLVIRRGVSLLAMFFVSHAVQVGSAVGFLRGYVEAKGIAFDSDAYRTMLQCLVLHYVIGLGFLVYEKPVKVEGTWRSIGGQLTRWWPAILVMGAALLGLRLSSSMAQYALANLSSLLDSDTYYQVRGELIFVGYDGYSRFESHFLYFSRCAITLFALIFGYRWGSRKDTISLLMFLTLVPALAIDALAGFNKAPVVVLLMAAIAAPLFGRWGQTGGTARRLWYASGIAGVGLATAALIASFFQELDFSESVSLAVNRTVLVPAEGTLMHFQTYPEKLPFVNFGSMRLIADMFDIRTAPINGSIALDVAQAMTGLLYNANAGIVANAWANAGFTGVIAYTMLAGVLFVAIDDYVVRGLSLAPAAPLAIYYASRCISFGNSSLEDSVITCGLVYIPFIYVFLVRAPKVVEQSYERNLARL